MSISEPQTDFDPYREWLKITSTQRPLGPYELLGLAPLESNAVKIQGALQRQMAALDGVPQSDDATLWEAVRREVTDAYDTLMDSTQKQLLDAAIKRRGVPVTRATKPATAAAAGASAAQTAHAGHAVTCRQCQKLNPVGRRFCGDCGAPLWESCPQCGSECPADERFCGGCGADVAGGVEQQAKQLEAKLAEARELLSAYRYDAAITVLRDVASVADKRLAKWAEQALADIAHVQQCREAQQAAAQDSLAQAKRHMEGYAYENAVHLLESIPEPLANVESQTLLERARSARKELLALGGEIRVALEQKKTADLLPRIQRLLALKPNHQQARQIGEQLRDNLVKQARQFLAQHRYREALENLERIPDFLRTEDVAKLVETATELEALLDGVKNAALADKPTLALAEKLAKLASTSEEAGKLKAQLALRSQTKPTEPRCGGPNWFPVPKRTLLGPPVDWLTSLTRLPTADDDVAARLTEHPGQLFVALGLALQGMGLARVTLDLSPEEKSGMLGMLPSLSIGRRGPSAAWGLDVSESGLKAIKLFQDPKPPKGTKAELKIAACEVIPHSKPLTRPDAELERGEIMEATLKEFLARAGELKGCKICINLPGHRVLGRFYELPPLPAKKVADAIAFEARHQLPFNLDELCWQSHTQDAVEAKLADDQPRRIMVVAARQAHVKDRLATFKTAGINVDLVQSDALALHNALVHELYGDEAGAGAVAAIDVGSENTNLVISSPHCVWFRTFGQGGDQVTSAIARETQLTLDQAAQLKREPAKARRFGKLQQALLPFAEQMAGEISRSLANYVKLYPDHPVEHVYGLGGAFQTFGLLRHLRIGK
ncbi:MAG: pilus assembly protein PilM [Pirellulaceae bacterium]|nr:pilus assembly protein PilM [Pirellulaceae bacterium]